MDGADANEIYYYHFDGLGSVVALSDVNNALAERYAYDAFGRPTLRDANGAAIDESGVGNPYLFTGRRYDVEAGLYYYRARYYDYYAGRFLQPDPIGYDDGLNMYAYCGNDPVGLVDPFGLCKESGNSRFYAAAPLIGIRPVVAPSRVTLGILAGKSGLIVKAGPAVAAGTATAVVAGGIGYGIGKFIVNPLLAIGFEKYVYSGVAADPQFARGKGPAKPYNPKKPKPPKPSPRREKNIGHPDGEEHSRVPKRPHIPQRGPGGGKR